MASFMENAYSLVHQDNVSDQPTLQELKTQLEKGTDEVWILRSRYEAIAVGRTNNDNLAYSLKWKR